MSKSAIDALFAHGKAYDYCIRLTIQGRWQRRTGVKIPLRLLSCRFPRSARIQRQYQFEIGQLSIPSGGPSPRRVCVGYRNQDLQP
jgi:hypothetical protein